MSDGKRIMLSYDFQVAANFPATMYAPFWGAGTDEIRS